MTNFEVPNDLTVLSVEDIHGLIETARAEFNTLNETDDLSDETLDAMTELADAIDELHAETSGRTELATKKRKGIFSKVFRLTDGAKAFQKKAAIAARVLPKVELVADTVTFNLSNLESALDHVDDAIDDLEDEGGPQVGSALSEARAAKTALKKALGNYDDGPEPTRRSPSSGGGGGVGVYSTTIVELNLAKTKSALGNVNDAIDALENGNASSALSNLRTASEQLENAIDDYDDGGGYDNGSSSIVVSTPPPDDMSTEDIVNLAAVGLLNRLTADGIIDMDAVTKEFASCSSARKRVRKARRSLRSALRALAKCSGYRVVVEGPTPEPAPPPPPPAGMSAEGVEEFASEEVKRKAELAVHVEALQKN